MTFKGLARSGQKSRDSIATHPSILPIPIIGNDTLVLWQEPHVVTYETTASSDVIVHAAVPSNNKYANFLRDTKTNEAYGTVASSSRGLLVTDTGASATTNIVEFAGTGTSVVGSEEDWTTPSNITADDSSVATVTLSNQTDWLYASNFGFAIPSGATINGIEVTINKSAVDNFGEVFVYDTDVQLYDGSAFSGDNKEKAAAWPTSLTDSVYGGSSDAWGVTLTPAMVNDSSFGVGLQAEHQLGGNSAVTTVDYITLEVFYSTDSLDNSLNKILMDSGDVLEWICAKGLKDVANITSATPVIDTDSERTNVSFTASSTSTFPMTFPLSLDSPTISVEVSNNGGSDWVSVSNGDQANFTTIGTELRMRWTASTDNSYWKTSNTAGYEKPIILLFKTT